MKTATLAMRALRLGVASVPVVAGLTVAGVASRVGPGTAGCVQASSVHHATLVVEHQSGAVTRVCVSFSTSQVTGQQLLDMSRVSYNTVDYGSYGKAVCQIEGEPASYPPSCWTASSPYWALFVSRGGGAWTSSSRGISAQTFADGDAEGFRYEAQSDASTPAPPAGVCPPPVASTPTPVTTSAAAAPARAGTSGVAAVHPTSAPAAGSAAPAATPAAAVSPSSPWPSGSSRPPVVGQVRAGAPPPPSPGSPTAAVWVAAGLGASLLALLVVQLARPRRTRVQP
jgi:hypothetical protein